jgi:hypothetical protein
MGIAEGLQRNKGLTIFLSLTVIVVAVASIFWNTRPDAPPPKAFAGQSFYTVDDGKTFFPDSSNKVPPFDEGGQTAVRAYVYTCDEGKTRFVGYLERFTPEGKKQMEEMMSQKQGAAIPLLTNTALSAAEVKKPGATEWVPKGDIEKAAPIFDVKCPHGGAHPVEPVMP